MTIIPPGKGTVNLACFAKGKRYLHRFHVERFKILNYSGGVRGSLLMLLLRSVGKACDLLYMGVN